MKLTKPIFIMGSPNSGTSMVWNSLLNHPHLCGPGLMDHADDLGQFHNIETKDLPGMPKVSQNSFGKSTFRMFAHPVFRGADYRDDATPYTTRAIKTVLGRYGQKGKRDVFKTPSEVMRAGMYETIFPDASLIGIRRNPYAVAEGIRRKRMKDPERPEFEGLRTTIEQSAQQWLYSNLVLEYQSHALKRCCIVYYEDFVNNTRETLHNILCFLGLPKDGLSIPSLRTDLNGLQISRLTEKEKEIISEICWPMVLWGYRNIYPIPDKTRIESAGL